LKTDALALMGTASFCGGVRRKRYSGQQEIAPSLSTILKITIIKTTQLEIKI